MRKLPLIAMIFLCISIAGCSGTKHNVTGIENDTTVLKQESEESNNGKLVDELAENLYIDASVEYIRQRL